MRPSANLAIYVCFETIRVLAGMSKRKQISGRKKGPPTSRRTPTSAAGHQPAPPGTGCGTLDRRAEFCAPGGLGGGRDKDLISHPPGGGAGGVRYRVFLKDPGVLLKDPGVL